MQRGGLSKRLKSKLLSETDCSLTFCVSRGLVFSRLVLVFFGLSFAGVVVPFLVGLSFVFSLLFSVCGRFSVDFRARRDKQRETAA